MRNYRGKDIEKIKKRDADEWWKNWRSICRRNRKSFLVRYLQFIESTYTDIPPKSPAYIVKIMYAGVFSVKDYIEERAVEIADYIIETKATVRQTAKKFGISKSTVHKDCTDRLQQINPSMARAVRSVLDINKQERHIRGGMATREKYLHLGE